MLVLLFLETNIGQFHSRRAKLKSWHGQLTPRIWQQARAAFPAVNGSYHDLTELLWYLKPLIQAASARCQLMLAWFEPAVSLYQGNTEAQTGFEPEKVVWYSIWKKSSFCLKRASHRNSTTFRCWCSSEVSPLRLHKTAHVTAYFSVISRQSGVCAACANTVVCHYEQP